MKYSLNCSCSYYHQSWQDFLHPFSGLLYTPPEIRNQDRQSTCRTGSRNTSLATKTSARIIPLHEFNSEQMPTASFKNPPPHSASQVCVITFTRFIIISWQRFFVIYFHVQKQRESVWAPKRKHLHLLLGMTSNPNCCVTLDSTPNPIVPELFLQLKSSTDANMGPCHPAEGIQTPMLCPLFTLFQ